MSAMRNKVTALVPMRHSSERVPGKNYREFCGRPLFHHVLLTLRECPSVGLVVVDTDSPVVMEQCAAEFPEVRVIARPEHLRAGTVPMNDVLLHDVAQAPSEWYLQTHSTNPLLRAETVERSIGEMMAAYPKKDSLFGVTRWQTRFYDALARPVNHDPAVLMRTQDLPPLFEENSNLYLFRGEQLKLLKNRIGERPILFEIDRLESVDIDDEAGWRLAEALHGVVLGRTA